MKKIGFIGLGIMGTGMAGRLHEAGYPLVIWNRTEEKTKPFAQKGAKIVSFPKEITNETDVIITMLSADQQVKEVLLGENGVIETVKKGQIIVDCSTVSPQTSRELHSRFAEKGVEFLDAPVTGSAPHAQEGSLGFIVGGSSEAYEQCLDLFETMGKQSVYMGASGCGANTKLISNTMSSISILALCEGLVMAKKSGLNLEEFLSAIKSGGANSRMVETKADLMVENNYTTQFAAALMNKDLNLATKMVDELQLFTPALRLSKESFTATVNKGFGEDDVVSIFNVYQELGNIQK